MTSCIFDGKIFLEMNLQLHSHVKFPQPLSQQALCFIAGTLAYYTLVLRVVIVPTYSIHSIKIFEFQERVETDKPEGSDALVLIFDGKSYIMHGLNVKRVDYPYIPNTPEASSTVESDQAHSANSIACQLGWLLLELRLSMVCTLLEIWQSRTQRTM